MRRMGIVHPHHTPLWYVATWGTDKGRSVKCPDLLEMLGRLALISPSSSGMADLSAEAWWKRRCVPGIGANILGATVGVVRPPAVLEQGITP